ncbi:MAG: hypothetical protein KGM16_16180 [Bacteroidota bacterium]|nr:hypothetical protein [Bacteroidota bacterium]
MGNYFYNANCIWIGAFFTWIGKSINKNSDRKKYKESLNLLLNHFAQGCKNQHDSIRRSLKNSGLEKGNDFSITFPTIKTLTYLSDLDLSIFIKYYVSNKNKKLKSIAVTQLFETIGNINAIQIEAKELIEYFRKESGNYETNYRSSLQKVVSLHDTILNNFKVNDHSPNPNSMDDKLIQIFERWSQLGENKNSIFNTYNSIIKPTEALVYEFDKSTNSLILLDLVIPCHEAYINIEKIYNHLIDDYKRYAKISYKIIRSCINHPKTI